MENRTSVTGEFAKRDHKIEMKHQGLFDALTVVVKYLNPDLVHDQNCNWAEFLRLDSSAEGLKEVTCQVLKICLSHLTAGRVLRIQQKDLSLRKEIHLAAQSIIYTW